MSTIHYVGGCLCGAVRLESRVEPRRVGICHCLDCRKHSGAIFTTNAIFAVGDVTISGKTSEYAGRNFCPTCGSSVFARTGDEIDVAVGSFDVPKQFKPTYELWVCRREAWLPAIDGARRYNRDCEGTSPTEP